MNTLATEEIVQVKKLVPKFSSRSWEGVRGGVYYLVETMEQYHEFWQECRKQKILAVDTETSGLNWVRAHACGIVIGWGVEYNFYLPIAHTTGEKQLNLDDIRESLKEILEDPTVQKVFWNEKFDRHFLRKCGIDVKGAIHDGVVIVHLLDENTDKALKDFSKVRIHPQADKWEKDIDKWRKEESKKRKKAYSDLVTAYVRDHRPEVEAQALPYASFTGLTKQQILARLKKYVRENILNGHPLSFCKKEHVSYDQVPLEIMTPYACADVHYTLLHYKDLISKVSLHDDLKHLYITEMELSDTLYHTERIGQKIDVPYLRRIEPDYVKEVKDFAEEIFADVGFEFKIDSNIQLIEALTKVGVRLTKLTKAGKKLQKAGGKVELKHFSVDDEALEYLATTHPFAAKIQTYRKKQKVLNTYIRKIAQMVDDNHFLHSTFNANVSTGRMSSHEPNTQNIGSRDLSIRRAFTVPEVVGREGLDIESSEFVYLFADYSQVELRLTAHHSQDPTLIAAYPWVGKELDVHSITCAEVVMNRPLDEVLLINGDEDHPEYYDVSWYRNIAKRVNFGIIYGAGPDAIQRQVSTPARQVSREDCSDYIDKYFVKYGGVESWIGNVQRALKKYGYLQNTFGRYRRLPDSQVREKWKRERAGRQGVNFLIQGDAADLFKQAIVRIRNLLRKENAKTRIVNFVHDDIQFYLHKDEFHLLEPIKQTMEDFPQFSVPIRVSMSVSKRDWASKKALK